MIVNILGVGRSGTTALYFGLQQLLRDHFGGSVRSFYEPFLREPDTVNALHSDDLEHYQYIDSISPEGILNHKRLPMLIEDARRHQDCSYLKDIYRHETRHKEKWDFTKTNGPDAGHRLVKYIRACGRYRLVDQVCPGGKSLY